MTWLAVLLLPACYTESRYQDDLAHALCDLYDECGYLEALGVTTKKECVDVMSSGTLECEGYDGGSASDCVDGVETLDCEAHAEGQWPRACNEVCDSSVKVED